MIKEKIKKNFPLLYEKIRKIKNRANRSFLKPVLHFYRNYKKRNEWVAHKQNNQKKINSIKKKEKIKVVFLIIHRSTWKFDYLFDLMREDDVFIPLVFVLKDISSRANSATSWSEEEFINCYNYFENKGWDVFADEEMVAKHSKIKSTSLEKINPDVVILNNPHGLAGPKYGQSLVDDYLVCYIPYHFEGTSYGGNQAQYNSLTHNKCWKVYAPHTTSISTYGKIQAIKGENVRLVGHPIVDDLVSFDSISYDSWKPQYKKKLRIIWAPHQVLEDGALPGSCFIDKHQFFLDLVKEFCEEIQWCFKPHPLLRPNLENHPDWGVKRTEEYFAEWENMDCAQINTGNYENLFKQSDALIHDSYSFMIEYLFLNKPLVFLFRSNKQKDFLNDFGLKALSAHTKANSESEIRSFIESLLEGKDTEYNQREQFLNSYWKSIGKVSPSKTIVQDLKSSLR